MTDKDKKIIENAERDGTPIFVFTAKDKLALQQLINYRDDCSDVCSNEHYKNIERRIDEWVKWQEENDGDMKLPD